jgi:hypothetical protein
MNVVGPVQSDAVLENNPVENVIEKNDQHDRNRYQDDMAKDILGTSQYMEFEHGFIPHPAAVCRST